MKKLNITRCGEMEQIYMWGNGTEIDGLGKGTEIDGGK